MKQVVNYTEDLSQEHINNISQDHVNNGILAFELKEIRYPICKKCDKFDKNLKSCFECGCFMPMKTLYVSSTCPLKKW